MSNQLTLESRTAQGKKLKALRAAGQIPSVVYGGEEPVLGASAYNATEKVLLEAGYHSPVELLIAGKPQLAIVKNIAVDPVSRRIMNVEFQAISADEVVEATTPIRVVNFDSSDAAKLHYVIMPVLEEIEVKAKPSDLPELTIDGSKLAGTEDKLTIADLVLPKGVELADKELEVTTVIANVYDPVAEAAARDAEDQKAAEGADAPAAEAAPAEKAE
mgnify:CR=1 FL=1